MAGSTVIRSVTTKIGTSEVYAEGGYVVFVTPGQMTKHISPATFKSRAVALHKEAELMRAFGDKYRDEIKKRVTLAAAMMDVAKEAEKQVLVEAPIAAIVDPELNKVFKSGYAAKLYTGLELPESGAST